MSLPPPEVTVESSLDARLARVVEILRRLRAPEGCPWDRKQTMDSIRPHTIEETYEVLEAIGDRDWPGLREELGDLLLQVLFYAVMAEEQALFTLGDVLTELGDKLVRRHPHVFQESSAGLSPEQALGRWNAAKAAEKQAAEKGDKRKSLLDGIPRELPGLAEAAKLGQRAAGVHFDWPDADGVFAKVEEETTELRAATNAEQRETELGDLLFTVANLARHYGIEPESAVKRANRKFQRRFQAMEANVASQGTGLEQLSAEQWEEQWQRAKRG